MNRHKNPQSTWVYCPEHDRQNCSPIKQCTYRKENHMCTNTEKFKEQLCDLSTAFTVGLNAMARELDEKKPEPSGLFLDHLIKYHQDYEDLAKLRKIEVQLTRVDQDIHSQEGHDPTECTYVTKDSDNNIVC